MPKKGINRRDLPQLLDPQHAIRIINYILSADGGMPKREGYSEVLDQEDANPITALEKWQGYIAFGWGGDSGQWSLSAYDLSTGAITDIKTDFDSPVTSLDGYGAYLIVASPLHRVGRVTLTLAYDGQTGNFATGLELTGGTSGATAKIQQDTDAGATGTLVLGDIEGVFADNETITDSATGSAAVNGAIAFAFTEISNAPRAKYAKVMDRRCFAWNLEEDEAATRYSHIDSGANPPFNTWSVTTSNTAGGLLSLRRGGAALATEKFGNIFMIYHRRGRYGFTIDTIDSGGTITKVDNVVYERIDSGATAALQTKKGIFYVNRQGIFQTVSVGQGDIKFSEQEILASNILGNSYFERANFDDADMIEDEKRNLLLITYRDDSDRNNRVLCYNTDLKAFSVFTGWNIGKFLKINGDIYGGASNTGKIYKLFDGHDDNGSDISCEMEQELNVGQLWTRKGMLGQYIQGKLSPSSSVGLTFNAYDEAGRLVEDKLSLTWTASSGLYSSSEYGSTPYGGAYGGSSTATGLVESFAGAKKAIRNFQRIRVKTYESSKVPHEINWLSIQTREKNPIRIRNLT